MLIIIFKPPQSCDLVWLGLNGNVWFVRLNSPCYSLLFKLNSVNNSSEHTSTVKKKSSKIWTER